MIKNNNNSDLCYKRITPIDMVGKNSNEPQLKIISKHVNLKKNWEKNIVNVD